MFISYGSPDKYATWSFSVESVSGEMPCAGRGALAGWGSGGGERRLNA